MPLKDRGKKLREFININHELVNSHRMLSLIFIFVMKRGRQYCKVLNDSHFCDTGPLSFFPPD